MSSESIVDGKTLSELLRDLKDVAGPQFPACLFESPPRQPVFQLGTARAIMLHGGAFYDTTKRRSYAALEDWVAATLAGSHMALAASAAASLQFGGTGAWLTATELRHRAELLLAEFETHVPTLSELLLHVNYLCELRDASLWDGRTWKDALYVFDTDNRSKLGVQFYLEYAPRISCKFQDGKFVDKKTSKRFKTLEGWLAICGEDADLEAVRFSRHSQGRLRGEPLTMTEVYHRLQVVLALRRESYHVYEKCVWRYQYICNGTYDEEEWDCWTEEGDDADTVWSE